MRQWLNIVLARWANASHAKQIATLEEKVATLEASLRVASTENRLLSNLAETDIARRKRERSEHDAARALATAASRSVDGEGEE